MAVSPTGLISVPDSRLRTMLSNSAAFKTWTGAADATEALAFIKLQAVAGSYTDPVVALIGMGEFNHTRFAGVNAFKNQGSLRMLIEADITESEDVDAYYDFTNRIGAIVEELGDLSGGGDYLLIDDIAFEEKPRRCDADEEGSATAYYTAVLNISYGA